MFLWSANILTVFPVNADQIDKSELVTHPFRLPFGHLFTVLIAALAASFRSRAAQIPALRHQIGVLQRSVKRPKLTPADRLLWAWLCAVWWPVARSKPIVSDMVAAKPAVTTGGLFLDS
jgi:hypothetical protein